MRDRFEGEWMPAYNHSHPDRQNETISFRQAFMLNKIKLATFRSEKADCVCFCSSFLAALA